jgi:iron complex outermembrane receptor protein
LVVAGSLSAPAQTERPLTWQQDLNYLANASSLNPADVFTTLANIRAELENWLRLHPDSTIKLPPALTQPGSVEQTRVQIKLLQETVASILKQDPNRPFHLGTAEVNVTASASELSPIADSIDQTELSKRNDVNVAMAMEDLPGVSIEHTYGGRNQSEIWVHGFGYLQVPLYLDGIPMYVPYDGTMDFKRLQTSDIAEIQVAKGFSSPLLGPNAVGGAINVVTKEPQKKLEGDALIGGSSGDGLLSSLRLGTRWQRFFVQGTMDWLQSDYVPLSGNFATNILQPNDRLNHSYQQDAKYSGRFGWTPRGQDEYVFSYINQKANEGIPLSTGNDPLPGTGCGGPGTTAKTCYFGSSYRSWGYWDKTSYYFHSNTGLGESSSLKMRVFYDQYPNLMLFYTGLPYSPAKLNTQQGYITTYDDHSDGISTEFTTRLLPRNTISGSFLFKDDTHKDIPMVPYSAPTPATASDRQQVTSIGLQDVVQITSHLISTIGFSADHLSVLRATNESTYYALVNPQCPSNTNQNDFSACTPHDWAYNPQISFTYAFKDSGKLFAGLAQKTRFPGLKELYSSKMNKGLPNPDLQPERSQNWVFGYSKAFKARTVAQLEFFRSNLHDAIESVNVPQQPATNPCLGNTLQNNCSVDENASKEVHEGVEFTLRTTPLPRLTFDANYTYLDKQISGFLFRGQPIVDYPCGGGLLAVGTGSNVQPTTVANNTCLTATDIPKHKAVVSGTFRLPRESMLTASVRYESGTKAQDSYSVGSGSSAVNYYEILPMSNFATVDLGGTVRLYKGASMQAGVKNLFDRNYFYVLDFPEEGRNWYLNMRYQF